MVNREGVYLAAASVLLICVGVVAAVPMLEWEIRRLLLPDPDEVRKAQKEGRYECVSDESVGLSDD